MKSSYHLYSLLFLLALCALLIDAMESKIDFSFTQVDDGEFMAEFFLNNAPAGRATIFDITEENQKPKRAYLASFCINSACRKVGYGSQFLFYIMHELKRLQFQQITGKVQPFFAGSFADESRANIPRLIAFYKRHGFEPTDPTEERRMACNLEEVEIPIIDKKNYSRL